MLINNAGIMPLGPIELLPEEWHRKVWEVGGSDFWRLLAAADQGVETPELAICAAHVWLIACTKLAALMHGSPIVCVPSAWLPFLHFATAMVLVAC